MDPGIWAALIGVASAVITAALTLYGTRWREQAKATAKTRAVLARYRDPLIHATFFLQQRLFQILREDGRDFGHYLRGPDRAELAMKSTLYRLGEYLAWAEILRREIQFLPLSDPAEARKVQNLIGNVSRALATDRGYGTDFMLWVEEQRAIAELMIVQRGQVTTCIGFAAFTEDYDRTFEHWFTEFASRLAAGDLLGQPRLTDLFNELLELGCALDPEDLRYTWREFQEPTTIIDEDGREAVRRVGKLK